MKALILIPAIALTTLLSSFQQPPTWDHKTSLTANRVEGLFGEEDCTPGVVYSFTRNGKELPYQSPYVFHFCPDHTLSAVGANGSYEGTWYKQPETNTVYIDIQGPHEIFELVSGTWNIIAHTEDALELSTFDKGEYQTVRFERIQR